MLTMLNERDRQLLAGFEGGESIASLRATRFAELPEDAGVYAVLLPDEQAPEFVNPGTGGFFKGENPNVDVPVLRAKWVHGTRLLYIGKAGGPGVGATMRSRIRQLSSFGQGKAVGHRGGRYLWQLAEADRLCLAWELTPGETPQEVEHQLIRDFERLYGKRPFANLIG